jgi:RNA polymerase sigma-70 factor (ECF subfamily)
LVYQWVRQSGIQASDAADILQEVFRAVHRKIQDFRADEPGSTFRGWLWTITRNKIHDHFRAQAGRENAVGGTDAQGRIADLPDREPTSISDAVRDSEKTNLPLMRGVELVRGEFEPQTWKAFWRTAVDGVVTKEVADELGISVNAVRLAKSRVLRRLRAELKGLVD